MKYATILIGHMTAMTAAEAKIDRDCIREQSETFGVAAAKRICDSKNYVKPNQLGWLCQIEGDEVKFHKGEGGARLKRDVICE